MELLSAPLPGTESVTPPYGTSLALALVLFLTFAALQSLLWGRVRRLWLRLAPLWLSGLLCLVFLLCVINLYHPYKTGFALFCALACLLGSLAGAACGWLRRRK